MFMCELEAGKEKQPSDAIEEVEIDGLCSNGTDEDDNDAPSKLDSDYEGIFICLSSLV